MLQFYTTPSDRFSVPEQVHMAILGGCRWINLCKGDADGVSLKNLAEQIIPECRENDIFLVIDDDTELVKEFRVHGVRITDPQLSPREVREELGPHAIIGVAVQSAADMAALKGVDVDYVTVDTSRLMEIASVAAAMSIPVVATGDINIENMRQLMQHGAQGIGLSRAVTEAFDPETYIRQALDEL